MNMEKEDILFATTGTVVNRAEGFGKDEAIPYIRNLPPQEENFVKEKEVTPITRRRTDVPIWEKSNLTLEEAAAYFGIGVGTLRRLSDNEKCPFVLWCGSKRLIKRRALDEYLEKAYSV